MPGPHDLFVRYTFGSPERAAAELHAVLPAHVVSAVDWSSLRQEPGSVVDPELRETESDLLFTARLRTGESVLLYVELPEAERELWRGLVPRFEYLLDDLTAEREEVLLARAGPPLVPDWVALFAEVHAAPEGAEHLGVVVRYLLYIGDKAAREAARRVVDSVMDAQRAEELMRSYGEELIEQGVAKGRAEYVLRVLAARGVHVGDEARQRILTCMDMATLDRWFDRALNASTLSEVLDDVAR